jgi:hypothetical protein
MGVRRLIVRESLYGGKSDESDDYAEAHWKMDKFMPDDEDSQNEYYEILDDTTLLREEKIKKLISILECGDEEIMQHYFPIGGTIEGFAEYIVDTEG